MTFMDVWALAREWKFYREMFGVEISNLLDGSRFAIHHEWWSGFPEKTEQLPQIKP
ncbi:hypothetical protein [Streptomyces sp. NPDC004285]